MPLFRFKSTESKKSKAPPKKASSMNNIYNDYGSPPEAQSQQNPSQKKKGGTLYDFLNDEQNQIQSQWRGESVSSQCGNLIKFDLQNGEYRVLAVRPRKQRSRLWSPKTKSLTMRIIC